MRPVTYSLARLVEGLAQLEPPFGSWPGEWIVKVDAMRAAGDESWQAQWWYALQEWTTAGKHPDGDRLAPLLDVLTPEPESSTPDELRLRTAVEEALRELLAAGPVPYSPAAFNEFERPPYLGSAGEPVTHPMTIELDDEHPRAPSLVTTIARFRDSPRPPQNDAIDALALAVRQARRFLMPLDDET